MKKTRILTVIFLISLVLTGMVPSAYALEDPTLRSTDAMILMDVNTGSVLYEKNMDMHHSIASLTKVMTGLLAVEAVERGEVSLDEMVTAGQDCLTGLEADSSNSGIVPGEEMSFKDILYCAMVQSANEACNIIGTRVAGSISAFVDLMNERAQELGCKDTHFMDPNGLTNRDGDHYSTPYELSIIVREAISHPLFWEICNTASYDVPATNVREGFTITNSNALISAGSIYGSGYLYDGAAGVKTGFTKPAGYCLISTCERDGIRLLAIVLGCNGDLTYTHSDEYENFVDSRALYDWAYGNFSYREMLTAGEAMQQISVEHSKDGEQAVLRPADSMKLLLPKDVSEDAIEKKITVTNLNPIAPLEAGTELGYVTVYVNGENMGTVKLVTSNTIAVDKAYYFKESIKKILHSGWVKLLVFIIVLAVAVYFLLLYRYRKMQKKHRQERMRAEQRRRQEVESRKQFAEERARSRKKEKVYTEDEDDEPTQYYTKINPETRETEQQDIDEIIRSLGLDR